MAFSGNQYGDITSRVGVHIIGKFLAHAQNELFLEQYASHEPVPKNKGQTVKWKRAIPLAVSATTLTEGVTKAPKMYEDEVVNVTLSQYGDWMAFTDVIEDTHEDPVLNKMSEVLGQQAGAVKELILWNAVSNGTNVIYANGAGRSSVNTPITLADVRAAVSQLKMNRATKITKRVPASTNVATEPVAPSFIYFGHVAQETDFREMDSFLPVEAYGSYTPVSEYEIGKVEECRIVLTNHALPAYGAGSATLNGMRARDNTNVDVYLGVIFGQDAFGCTSLKGMDSANITVFKPKASYEDPHAQRGGMSWKFWYAALVLNQNWIVRIEAAATDL